MAQKGVSFGDGRQHFGRSIPILNVGPMNDKADEKTDRIGDDVALAPLDPFSGIIAENPATFSGFYAQVVDFHPEVTRIFHRELTRLKVMFCGLCWGQDMGCLLFLAICHR